MAKVARQERRFSAGEHSLNSRIFGSLNGLFKTKIMYFFFLDVGPAPKGGYIPLFGWANVNSSNTDTWETVNLFLLNKLLRMHSAHQQWSVKNCVKIMNKFSFQFLQPYESCLKNPDGPLESGRMGLFNEHLKIISGFCRLWISPVVDFKGGKEISQITLKVVERYQVVLKIN